MPWLELKAKVLILGVKTAGEVGLLGRAKPLTPLSRGYELAMTTPDERTRHLLQAGAFLKELREDKTVSEELPTGSSPLAPPLPDSLRGEDVG